MSASDGPGRDFRLAVSPSGKKVHGGVPSVCYTGFGDNREARGHGVSTMCDSVHRTAGVVPIVPTDGELERGEMLREACGHCTRATSRLPEGVERVLYGPWDNSPEPGDLTRAPTDSQGVAVRVDLDTYDWRSMLLKEAATR